MKVKSIPPGSEVKFNWHDVISFFSPRTDSRAHCIISLWTTLNVFLSNEVFSVLTLPLVFIVFRKFTAQNHNKYDYVRDDARKAGHHQCQGDGVTRF
jgi:hypothetical protein